METIIWSEQSRLDLFEIYKFIEKDSKFYADLTIDKIVDLVERLKLFPLSGRVIPELKNKNFREIIFGNY